MNVRPIRNDADHLEAVRQIERLWASPVGSLEADTADVLATLVDAYESARWPIADSDPVDLPRYAIDEMGRTQLELAEILGSAPRASELLNRKRALTIEMIDKISKGWGIPRGLLAVPYSLAKSAA